jgi:hypothetical protein
MIKLGLAFVGKAGLWPFLTLVQVLLYGDVVHVSSCSLVLVSRYKRVTTIGDFYMEDANARLIWRFDSIHYKTTHDNHGVHG